MDRQVGKTEVVRRALEVGRISLDKDIQYSGEVPTYADYMDKFRSKQITPVDVAVMALKGGRGQISTDYDAGTDRFTVSSRVEVSREEMWRLEQQTVKVNIKVSPQAEITTKRQRRKNRKIA